MTGLFHTHTVQRGAVRHICLHSNEITLKVQQLSYAAIFQLLDTCMQPVVAGPGSMGQESRGGLGGGQPNALAMERAE